MTSAEADDLDQLLDSALDDFADLDLAPPAREPTAAPAPVRGLGMGLPDLKAKRKGKQQRSAAALPPQASHAADALDQLMRETQEAVRGIESTAGAAGAVNEGMMEDLVKQFEQMAGNEDMDSIVQTMMQQLLSKEILHEPMKEIGERYPKWLEEHRSGLTVEDYDRYQRQYELILKLNEVYENDPDNFQKIVDLMQKMQECGQPPNDIVQELAPGLDFSQLSPDVLDASSNCCIM